MGFHVECSGADLLCKLRNNSTGFLNEPYGIYIIALATKIDKKAMKWLEEYEMQLDSITGPYAAFMLFYNEAILSAEQYPPIPPRLWARNGDIEIQVESKLITSGARAVDNVLRYDPRTHTNKNILLTSMTYESDVVARRLNIIEHIPCLVVFDNPESSNFYIISLKDSEERAFSDLRELISQYLNNEKNKEFVGLLGEWHQVNAKMEKLVFEIESLKYPGRNNDYYIYNELKKARDFLLEGKVKRFNEIVNRVEGKSQNQGAINWSEVKAKAKGISLVYSMKKKLSSNKIPESSREKIVLQLENLLDFNKEYDIVILNNEIEKYLFIKCDELIKLVLSSFGLKGQIDEGLNIFQQKENEIIFLGNQLNSIENKLMTMSRPSIKEHINKINRSKKLEKSKNFIVEKIDQSVQNIPAIFELISKGAQLFDS